MKNFFKKLSFVLAIAMVLTSLAPATASAAAKNYIKDSRTGKKVTSIYVYVGGAEATLTPYVNGKKASKVTIVNSNPERATVDDKGTITPVANGNTTLTFTKGKTTIGKVTVKVRTRAKALNIYDRAEYAAGKKEKLSEVTLKVGEKKDLQITMPISKAAKKVVKKSTYFTYAEYDSSVVKVNKLGNGQRHFEVEAVAAGTTKVTIVANQKTEKNVRADKYYKEASFTVEVKDEKLTAEQAGKKVIKVTGTDLTSEVADYVVKRGNATVNLKSVELNEEKTEAKITISNSALVKGDYTVTFKKDREATFTAEDAVVTTIEIADDFAIVVGSGADADKATVTYKVLNQFGEDVTTDVIADITVSGGAKGTGNETGLIKFSNNGTPYVPGVSKVSAVVVHNKTGVNVSKVLDVVSPSRLDEVSVVGLKKVKDGVLSEVALKEGNKTADLAEFYLLVEGKDQYGKAYAADLTLDSVNAYPISATGLEVATTAAVKVGTAYPYATFKLVVDPAKYANGLLAGKGSIKVVSTTSGKTASVDFEVAVATKIDTITIEAKDTIYGNVDNELDITVIDNAGNTLTKYDDVKSLDGVIKDNDGQAVKVTRKADGTAKFTYKPNSTNIDTIKILTYQSATNKVVTKNFDIKADQVIKSVVGIKPEVALSATKNQNFNITAADFLYQDQYYNTIDGKSALVSTVEFEAKFSDVLTTPGAVAGNTTVSAINMKATTEGAISVKVRPTNAGAEKDNDFEFTIKVVKLADVTDFTFTVNGLQKAGQALANYKVVAKNGSNSIELVEGQDFEFVDGTKNAPAITSGKTETLTATAKIVILNAEGKEVTAEYSYSNAAPEVATFKTKDADTEGYHYTTPSTSAITVTQALSIIEVKDQYGVVTSPSISGVRVKFSGAASTDTLTANNTPSVSLTFNSVGDKAIKIEYTFANGKTYTADVLIKVN